MSLSPVAYIALGFNAGDEDDMGVLEDLRNEDGEVDLGEIIFMQRNPNWDYKNETESQRNSRWAIERSLEKECPVEILMWGHYEYSRYFVAVRGAIIAQTDYESVLLGSEMPIVPPEYLAGAIRFLESIGVEYQPFRWNLMSGYF
jgi:hypothetical protein